MRPERIAIVEPRCRGLEHVPFNAALVATTLAAYPAAIVEVLGEATHLEAVRDLLRRTRGASCERISWAEVTVAPRKAAGRARAEASRALFRVLDRSFRERRPSAIIVATIDPFVLAMLKARLFRSWRGLPAVAVFHELLATLTRRPYRSLRWWSLTGSLAMPHPRSLRYVVLSGSIRTELARVAPRLARYVVAMDHPSLLGDLPDGAEPARPPPLRFGFVGGGRGAKGFKAFITLADAVRREYPAVEFEVIGSAPAAIAGGALSGLTWSEQKLPLVEFVRRLRGVTYAVWLGEPSHYRLVASGSLVDTLALGIPVICRSGPLVEYLFETLGNVGFRSASIEELQRHMLSAASGFPDRQYNELRKRVGLAKGALAPETGASQLRVALQHDSSTHGDV
jgi:glycosyltransferase involved in cell wall biosynthesis